MFVILLESFVETVKFIIPLLMLIFIGLFLTETLLLQTNISKKFEIVAKPLIKRANLPLECSVPLISAIGSHLTANAMLQQLRTNKIINDREVLLSSILSTMFIPIKEIKFHLGVIIPALGAYVGGIYIVITYIGTFVLVIVVLLAGKLFLPKKNYDIEYFDGTNNGEKDSKKEDKKKDKKDKFKKIIFYSFDASMKTFKKIFIIFTITTFIIFLLINLGIFDYVTKFIEPSANAIRIPANAIPALTAYIASPLVGYPMIGALVNENKISEDIAIITLLFGSIFMLPIIYIKFYFPQWISIFGFKLGTIRGLISMTVIMLTRGIFLLLFLTFNLG